MARGMLDILLDRPRPATPPPPPPPRCETDFDCNGGNGVCEAASGTCVCNPSWRGLLCNELSFKPNSGRRAYHSSAWASSGSPILEQLASRRDIPSRADGGKQQRPQGAEEEEEEEVVSSAVYHLFSSRMRNGCGLTHSDLNSEIIHLTSPNATGPYTIAATAPNGGVALGAVGSDTAWDNGSPYGPSVHRLPNGTYVMFYQAMLRTSGQPPSQDCSPTAGSGAHGQKNGSAAGPAGPNDPNATVGTGDGRRIGVALADSLDGPWRRSSTPLLHGTSLQPTGSTTTNAQTVCVDEQEPAVLIKQDGSVLIMWNCNDWRGKGPMQANATGGRGPQHILLATAPTIDGPFVRNATHNMLFSPSGATLWIDNRTGIHHGLFGTTIGSTPFGAGTHCWSNDGVVWEGQNNMPAFTGRVGWAQAPPQAVAQASAQASVLAWRGLPSLLLDGEPGSSYGQPRVLFTGAADCVGHSENETAGDGVPCGEVSDGATSAVASGTTKSYCALEELAT